MGSWARGSWGGALDAPSRRSRSRRFLFFWKLLLGWVFGGVVGVVVCLSREARKSQKRGNEQPDEEGRRPPRWLEPTRSRASRSSFVRWFLKKIGLSAPRRVSLRSPLLVACAQGHEAVVRLLLERGAAVNLASVGGATPLLMACAQGHAAIARLLLERGAAVEQAMDNGWRPLLAAWLLRGRSAALLPRRQPHQCGLSPHDSGAARSLQRS